LEEAAETPLEVGVDRFNFLLDTYSNIHQRLKSAIKMPPKKTLKSMGKKPSKAPRGRGRPRNPYTTPRPSRIIPMRIEFGHGVQPGYATGQPGAFQEGSNPFQTPVPHNVNTYNRTSAYGGGQSLPINRNLAGEFDESAINNTAGMTTPINDFTSRPTTIGPDSLAIDINSTPERGYTNFQYQNEDHDNGEILSMEEGRPQVVNTPVGMINGEAISPIFYQVMDSNPLLGSVLRQQIDLNPDERSIRVHLWNEAARLEERINAGDATPEQQARYDQVVSEMEDDIHMTRILMRIEELRQIGSGQNHGLPSFQESQYRIHQGEGGASATLIEQRRADGYAANDDIVHASLNDSAGVNPHHAPVDSDFSRPEHVYGTSRVPTVSRQGHENGRESVHPSMMGMPTTPQGQSAHQLTVSFNTPAVTNTSNQSTATSSMYTGNSGAGATVPATGGYVNVTPPTSVPSLMDLAPAADLPIRSYGPAVLTAKTPASGVYWNAARHGQAVYA